MSFAQSHWIPCGGGRLTAAGAPSRAGLEAWVGRGATDVVTLQRADEMRAALPEDCRALGLRWWHLPLSGRKLRQPRDLETLGRLAELLAPLREGRALLVHCAAGLHRTGLSLYLILRLSGRAPEEALASIEEARPLTAQELVRRTRRSGQLLELAEARFEALATQRGSTAPMDGAEPLG